MEMVKMLISRKQLYNCFFLFGMRFSYESTDVL